MILDTDICIELIHKNEKVVGEYLTSKGTIHLCSMTVSELFYGVYNSSNVDFHFAKTVGFCSGFPTLNPNQESCRLFGQLKAHLRINGDIIPDADLIIASTAMANNMILVSNNSKHFDRLTSFGLRIENWLK